MTFFKNKFIFLFLLTFLYIFINYSNPIISYADEYNIIQKTIYHKHTGNSTSGGGCHGKAVTATRTYQKNCEGTLVYYPALDTTGCNVCGAGYSGEYYVGHRCFHSETMSEQYTRYDLSCGKTSSTIAGSLTVKYPNVLWAKELEVSMEYTAEDMMVDSMAFSINGTNTSNTQLLIEENGKYEFKLNGNDNSTAADTPIIVNINNIDRTAPVLSEPEISPAEWVKNSVLITVKDSLDLQPDGSSGCGLNETAYSFDGGNSFAAENFAEVYENGTYTIIVRDALLNSRSLDISIDNIDNEAPNIKNIEWNKSKNIKNTTITFEADDIMKDGRAGSGLDPLPYSFDGSNWHNTPKLQVTANGNYTIYVRDILGNINKKTIAINNLDTFPPAVSHYLYPNYWTNKNVYVTFEAIDINPDSSNGCGLPKECFSFDSGKTWNESGEISVTENGDVKVAVRDNLGNTIYTQANVSIIDKTPPAIELSAILSENKKSAVVTANVIDKESGVAANSFSWNGMPPGLNTVIEINKNGIVYLSVCDKAGNLTEASINIQGILEPFPIIPILKKQPLSEEKDSDVLANYPKQNNPTISYTPKTEAVKTTPAYSSQTVNHTSGEKHISALGEILFVLAIIILLSLTVMLLFIKTFTVKVSCISEALINSNNPISDKKNSPKSITEFLCFRLIKKKDEEFYVDIPESVIAKSNGIDYIFTFSRLFLFFYKNSIIFINFPDEKIFKQEIYDSIKITLL